MPLCYKIDVLHALKDAGFNTNKIRQEKLFSEGTLQKMREKKPIGWANLEQICTLLNCQPGDIIMYSNDEEI